MNLTHVSLESDEAACSFRYEQDLFWNGTWQTRKKTLALATDVIASPQYSPSIALSRG